MLARPLGTAFVEVCSCRQRHHLAAAARAGIVTFGLAGLIAASTALLPKTALADTAEELQSAQQAVQESNLAYEEASSRVEELEEQIDANQDHIDELEAQLPELQERANDSIRSLYKMQQGSGSLIELLLSADDFFDLVSTIQYLDVIQSRNSSAVDELVELTDELALTQANLSAQMSEAEEEQERAAQALSEAQDARDRLEAQIAAQAAAEEAARRAAIEAAQRAAQAAEQTPGEDATFTNESGTQAPIEVPETADPDIVIPRATRRSSSPSGRRASTPYRRPPSPGRARRLPRPPGSTAATRASPPPSPWWRAARDATASCRTTPGAGALELEQLGGRPSGRVASRPATAASSRLTRRSTARPTPTSGTRACWPTCRASRVSRPHRDLGSAPRPGLRAGRNVRSNCPSPTTYAVRYTMAMMSTKPTISAGEKDVLSQTTVAIVAVTGSIVPSKLARMDRRPSRPAGRARTRQGSHHDARREHRHRHAVERAACAPRAGRPPRG